MSLIVIIEDNPDNARHASRILQREGFEVTVADEGELGLQIAVESLPALILVDLGLPDLDGMEVLQRMRKHHRFGVLIVTGRSDTYDRVMGLELGADDYLTKPFSSRECWPAFARCCGACRRRRRWPT